MTVSIDWGTKVIYVPQSDLTPKGGVLYELDLNWFRIQLRDLEDNEAGIPFLMTHRHNTEVLLSGVIYARTVEIINDYTVEFEDGQYVVSCVGANHNLADVKVANQVSLIIGNAAGLIKVETGVSGLTPEESDQLMGLPSAAESADAIWDELFAGHQISGSFGELAYRVLRATEVRRGKVTDTGGTVMKFRTNLTETANGFWDRAGFMFTSGQCMGQIRGIKNYNGSTKEVSVETPFSYAPANNDTFVIVTPRKYLAPNLDDIPPMVRDELATELAEIDTIKAFVANRLRVNKTTGAWTVYAADKVTPLFTGAISDDGTFKDRVPT